MLGGQPNNGLQFCFPLKLHAVGSDFGLNDGSNLQTIDEMAGAGCFGC